MFGRFQLSEYLSERHHKTAQFSAVELGGKAEIPPTDPTHCTPGARKATQVPIQVPPLPSQKDILAFHHLLSVITESNSRLHAVPLRHVIMALLWASDVPAQRVVAFTGWLDKGDTPETSQAQFIPAEDIVASFIAMTSYILGCTFEDIISRNGAHQLPLGRKAPVARSRNATLYALAWDITSGKKFSWMQAIRGVFAKTWRLDQLARDQFPSLPIRMKSSTKHPSYWELEKENIRLAAQVEELSKSQRTTQQQRSREYLAQELKWTNAELSHKAMVEKMSLSHKCQVQTMEQRHNGQIRELNAMLLTMLLQKFEVKLKESKVKDEEARKVEQAELIHKGIKDMGPQNGGKRYREEVVDNALVLITNRKRKLVHEWPSSRK